MNDLGHRPTSPRSHLCRVPSTILPTEKMESVVPGPGTRRNARGRIACTVCHRRKVRCNSAIVGIPCSNCFQDGEECTLRVSNRGKHKRSRKGDELESTGSSPRYTAVTTNIAVAADVQQPVTSARNGNDALSISAIISKTPPQLTAPALESAHLPSVEEDQGEHVEWARYNARPVEHESHLVPFHCGLFYSLNPVLMHGPVPP